MHQDGCLWGQLYFRNIPQWLLLKDSCKNISILEILGYTCFTFFTLTSCYRRTNFYIFLSEGFGEKCEHTELALNNIFVGKPIFPSLYSNSNTVNQQKFVFKFFIF